MGLLEKSQLGAPRIARWDSEKSSDHKHDMDRGRAANISKIRAIRVP
jgi:hypothetical protein